METIIGIAFIVIIVGIGLLYHYSEQRKQKKLFVPGTGKQCMLTASKFEWCTPPVQGDNLNGKLQEKPVLYYRELSREVIYKAPDGFQLVGISYEYWDEIPHKF